MAASFLAERIERHGCYKTRCNLCGKSHAPGLIHFFHFNGKEHQCCKRCTRYVPDIHRREMHDRFYEEPDAQQPLWRYMELPKFIDLVISRRLWFSQVASLEDKFEGALGAKKHQLGWRRWMRNHVEHLIRNPPKLPSGEKPAELSEARIAEEADRLVAEAENALGRQKNSTYINCWQLSNHESFLMWKVYAAGQSDSLCIKTNYKRVFKSLTQGASAGVVRYIDFSKAFSDVNWPFLYKRAAFIQESEVRLFLREWHLDQIGFHISVDPQILIEEIVFSPDAPAWLMQTVERLIKLAKIDLPTRVSDLNAEPF